MSNRGATFEALGYIGLGMLLALRAANFGGSGADAALMAASVAFFVLVQVVLLALRAPAVVRVIYAYLATPYYANRGLAEVWLGHPSEASSGTFAPVLLGDLVLLLVLVRARPRVPLALLGTLALLATPLAAFVWIDGFQPGAFVYQYLNVARIVIVTWFVARCMRDHRRALEPHGVVIHLGFVFAVMALFSGTLAFATGARFGFPGWGANVFANALCVVGVLCSWYGLRRRHLGLLLLAAACAFGIVGTGTRGALVLFTLTLGALLGLSLVPRRARAAAAVLTAVAVATVLLAMPGPVVAGIADVNPRLRTVGGVDLSADMRALELVEAVGRESSVRTRLTLWAGSLEMVSHSPLVGVGWGQWNWQKARFGVDFDVLLDPHNGYLWLLAEGGLVAVGVLLVILALWLPRLPASPFTLALGLIAVFELANANVQKGLFGVLASVVFGVIAAQAVDRFRAPSRAVHEWRLGRRLHGSETEPAA